MKPLLTGVLAGVLATLLSACSIYPTIDESHGKRTYDVVRDFRCEARDAIAGKMFGLVRVFFLDTVVYKGLTGRQMIDAINRGDFNYSGIDYSKLDRRLWSYWQYYFNAIVAFDFTLQVEEQNNQDLTLGFSAKRFGESSKLPLALENDHKRNVSRNFFIFDTWRDLFQDPVMDTYCEPTPEEPNFQYPLAGKLKIKNLITEFVDLNQSGNLSNKSALDSQKPVVSTVSDTLLYTTKVTANFDPLAVVGAAVSRYTLTNLGAGVDNYRSDINTVIITVSMPPNKGGFTVQRSLNTSGNPNNDNARALAAQEAERQRDNLTKNSLIQFGTNAANFFH